MVTAKTVAEVAEAAEAAVEGGGSRNPLQEDGRRNSGVNARQERGGNWGFDEWQNGPSAGDSGA